VTAVVKVLFPARSRHEVVREIKFFSSERTRGLCPASKGAAGDGRGELAVAVVVRT
jgi:hypothetical protein